MLYVSPFSVIKSKNSLINSKTLHKNKLHKTQKTTHIHQEINMIDSNGFVVEGSSFGKNIST